MLPSSAIPKSSPLHVKTVVCTNADLVGKDSKMMTLAVALAREAFFGEVMAQCTAKGYGGKPGLPHKEMMLLKVCQLYPNYWNSPHVFEKKWNKCSEQISQACNRIRARRKRSTLSKVQTVLLPDYSILLLHINEITIIITFGNNRRDMYSAAATQE